MGLILGAIHKTGSVAWELPASINTAFQQLGLMMFLAAVGLKSGDAFVASAFSLQGVLAMVVAAIVTANTLAVFIIIARLLGSFSARGSGAMSGVFGNAAVLQYALGNSSDSRIIAGYMATFAIAMISKIVLIPFMLLI